LFAITHPVQDPFRLHMRDAVRNCQRVVFFRGQGYNAAMMKRPSKKLVRRLKQRRRGLDRVLAEIRKRHPLPASEAERAHLADHSDLYGPDGLPR
jgi:hypothetical protein